MSQKGDYELQPVVHGARPTTDDQKKTLGSSSGAQPSTRPHPAQDFTARFNAHLESQIRSRLTNWITQEKAANAFADVVVRTEKHQEIFGVIANDKELDSANARQLVAELASYLGSEENRKDIYLPLFKLAHWKGLWSLVVILFEQLKDAIPKAAATLLRTDLNPSADSMVADPLSVLATKGALTAEDYKDLLSVPYSMLHTGVRGWVSLLESVPEDVFQAILPTVCDHVPDPSESEVAVFLECCHESLPAITAKGRIRGAIEQGLESGAEQLPGVASTLEKVLNLPILQALEGTSERTRGIAAKRLLIAMVEKESQVITDQKEAAVSVLQKLVDNPQVGIEEVELIANALPDIAVNLFPGDEVDPNKPSLITLAAKRGPAYSTAVICLFEAGCKQLKVYLPSVLSNLVQERIEEHALTAIIQNVIENHTDVTLDEVFLDKIAKNGYVSTALELLKVHPNPRTHPIISMFYGALLHSVDEDTLLRALDELDPDLYAPNCQRALHWAAELGFTDVAKQTLIRGYNKLLWVRDSEYRLPLQLAVLKEKFATAEILLRNMRERGTVNLFKCSNEDPPKINLHLLLEMVVKYREEVENRNPQEKSKKNKKKIVDELQQFIKAVLDTGVSEDLVDHELLLANVNGRIPVEYIHQMKAGSSTTGKVVATQGGKSPSSFSTSSDSDLPETCYDIIASNELQKGDSDWEATHIGGRFINSGYKADSAAGKLMTAALKASDWLNGQLSSVMQLDSCKALCMEYHVLQAHESYRSVVNDKWNRYGLIVQMVLFVLYITFMAFLTTSLVLAARSSDPSTYSQSVDHFRLFCEIVTLLWIFWDVGLEVYNMCATCCTQRGLKLYPGKKRWQIFLYTLQIYFTVWQNWLITLSTLATLLIIPGRASDGNWQWVFAALAYILHGLRIFEYAVMFDSVGVYLQVLILVITRDVKNFILMFIVINLAFGGSLYFALRGEVDDTNNNSTDFDPILDTSLSTHTDETKEIYLVWITGIRILAEGSVIDPYYGAGGYRWLGVIIYYLLIFIVGVILINLLIAQFTTTYEEERGRARVLVTIIRTRLLLRMETILWIKPLLKLVRYARWTFGKTPVLCVKREESKDEDDPHKQLETIEERVQSVSIILRKQTNSEQKALQDLEARLLQGIEAKQTKFEATVQGRLDELATNVHGLENAITQLIADMKAMKDFLLPKND